MESKEETLDLDQEPAEAAPAERKPAKAKPVQEAKAENLTPYQIGQVLSFETPGGLHYSILIEGINGDRITLRNTIPGCAAVEMPLAAAQEILESPARVR